MALTNARWVWVLALLLWGQGVVGAEPKMRVLIYSGANNHNWKETTPKLEKILKSDPNLLVTVTNHPETITAEQLAECDVIVSNWNTFGKPDLTWPESTRRAFIQFVKKGGGHVTVHAGGSSFNDWAKYRQIAAYWGKDTNHGTVHEFTVKPTAVEHPITSGIKPFETNDELWNNTGFPAGSTTLMTAFSSEDKGGTGKEEAVLAVNRFGKGRCVNLMLGHNAIMMKNNGFQTLLSRSVEWAGTGTVKSTTHTKICPLQKKIEN